jgi:hypothetical protein
MDEISEIATVGTMKNVVISDVMVYNMEEA